ncbi:MAG: hypothetical protein AB1673_10840 [Actinomycetota bacterium]
MSIETTVVNGQPPAFASTSERLCRPFLYGTHYVVDRVSGRATFAGDVAPGGDVVVHPGLVGVAAAYALWLGRAAFHAGGFISREGAWAIVGAKGEGKTTLLAALAGRGAAILADDLLVLDGLTALAGPRTLDLRPDAAALVGQAQVTTRVRNGERGRLHVDVVPLAVPFRGWVELRAGPVVALDPVPPAERVSLMAPHALRPLGPARAATLLHLASRPAWRLQRPKRPEALAECVDMLETLLR